MILKLMLVWLILIINFIKRACCMPHLQYVNQC